MNPRSGIVKRISPGVLIIARVFALTLPLLLITNLLAAQTYKSLSIYESHKLSPELAEISGITYCGGKIYAINDSGNKNEIYILDHNTFEIISSKKVHGTENVDWEEITCFNNSIYIGDFGNNAGKRKDLKIYEVLEDSIFSKTSGARLIRFNYELQKSFKLSEYRRHIWDCEAMVINNHGIWLFSKDWPSRTSRMYKLDRESVNEQSVRAIDSLDLNFLVTGAYYENESGKVYFCGYEGKNTYLTILSTGEDISLSGKYTTYIIPELVFAQVESIFVMGNVVYLASERTKLTQAIYKILLPEN